MTEIKKGSGLAYWAAAAAVASWSTVASAFKIALKYYGHYEMVTVAAAAAALIFAAVITFRRSWGCLARLSFREWCAMALLGLSCPAIYYMVLFSAYDNLPAQVAQPINYCWPIFLTLMLALMMHRPVRPRLYFGMLISFSGVAVISSGGSAIDGELSVRGILLALLSAVLWAAYWILNERLKSSVDENVKLFLSFFFGALFMALGAIFIPVDFSSEAGFWSSVYIGAFEMGVPFLFFSYALSHTDNVALVNQMCYIAPFLSLFLISMIVGERIVPTSYIGLSLIIGGVVYNKYLAYGNVANPR